MSTLGQRAGDQTMVHSSEGGGMPYLKVQTNQPVDDKRQEEILKKASRAIAQSLGKPEQYVMVSLEPSRKMLFAGSPAPAAFLDLRAIGLPASKTEALSKLLCDLMGAELSVPPDRIFINFADVSANLWGWNGETF